MPLNLAYIKVVLPPPKSTCIDRFISWGDKTRATHSDIATMCVSKTSKYTHQDRGKIGKLGHGSQRGDVYRRLESEASKSAVESLVGNGRNGRTLTERRRGLRRGGGDGDLAPFAFSLHRWWMGRAPSARAWKGTPLTRAQHNSALDGDGWRANSCLFQKVQIVFCRKQ